MENNDTLTRQLHPNSNFCVNIFWSTIFLIAGGLKLECMFEIFIVISNQMQNGY